MKVSSNSSSPLIDQAPHYIGASAPRQAHMRRPQGRLTHTDQLNLSPKAREVQQAGQMLAYMAEVREMRVVELRRDIENGHYAIKAEQVAERIVKNHILDLLY
jgi:flagellar biosynthesis anti-sigma factor FlgM